MGCFVYMFLGTSKDITLGPTAIMSLMVGTFAAAPNPDPDDPNMVGIAVTQAIVLTLFSGLVQLVMGLLNLGKIFLCPMSKVDDLSNFITLSVCLFLYVSVCFTFSAYISELIRQINFYKTW